MSKEQAVIYDLSPEHPQRQQVDATLAMVRRFDEHGGRYLMDRTSTEYMSHLLGLEYMLAQLSFLSGPSVVVDVGAGTTRGAQGLSELASIYGLDMQATVITPVGKRAERLSEDKIHVTSAEYMDGFERESVRGVVSVASITYSAAPELAIARIDQVLVKGGILKAAFAISDSIFSGPGKLIKNKTPFVVALNDLGYDVAVDEKTSDQFDVVLAIKPGGQSLKTAKELLAYDHNDHLAQIHDLVNSTERRNPLTEIDIKR